MTELKQLQATVWTFDEVDRRGSVILDDGGLLDFGADAFDAGGLRLLRPGQRVRLSVDPDADGDVARVNAITILTL